MNEAEVRSRLDAVAGAEARFRATVDGFSPDDLAAESLCAGWTRGHVVAHVALNAHSLVNLMDWARTGVETPQYPSWDARDAGIERAAARSKDEHLAALAEASAAFATAAEKVPLDRWDYEVRGIGGSPQPAARYLFARLREVEVHHVDLDAGYGSWDWDDAFVRAVLEDVPEWFRGEIDAGFAVEAADLGLRLEIGGGAVTDLVRGRGHELLAWLMGRSDGATLDAGGKALPEVPSWG